MQISKCESYGYAILTPQIGNEVLVSLKALQFSETERVNTFTWKNSGETTQNLILRKTDKQQIFTIERKETFLEGGVSKTNQCHNLTVRIPPRSEKLDSEFKITTFDNNNGTFDLKPVGCSNGLQEGEVYFSIDPSFDNSYKLWNGQPFTFRKETKEFTYTATCKLGSEEIKVATYHYPDDYFGEVQQRNAEIMRKVGLVVAAITAIVYTAGQIPGVPELTVKVIKELAALGIKYKKEIIQKIVRDIINEVNRKQITRQKFPNDPPNIERKIPTENVKKIVSSDLCANIKKYKLNKDEVKNMLCKMRKDFAEKNITVPEIDDATAQKIANGDCAALEEAWKGDDFDLTKEESEDLIKKSNESVENKDEECEDCTLKLEANGSSQICSSTSGRVELVRSGGEPDFEYKKHGEKDFQPNSIYENLKAGKYLFYVKDSKGCIADTIATINNIMLPLMVSTKTVKPTCKNNDGEIKIKAENGSCTFIEYKISSKAISLTQANPDFKNLPAGTYTAQVKDSEGNVATQTEIVLENTLDGIQVEASTYEPIFGIAIDQARIASPTLTVQWDANTKVYNFTPKEGVIIERIGDGKLRLTTTNPEDKKWEGEYKIYFLAKNHDEFVGFYNITMSGPCTSSGYHTNDCNKMCTERWLPKEVYDNVIIYDEILYTGNLPNEDVFEMQYFQIVEQDIEDNTNFLGKSNIFFLRSISEDQVRNIFEFAPNVGFRYVVGSPNNDEIINKFYSKTGGSITFSEISQLSQDLNGNRTFELYYASYINRIKEKITIPEELNKEFLFDDSDGKKGIGKPNFSKVLEIPQYDFYGIIGGTQRLEVTLKISKSGSNYTIESEFRIEDTFGADWDDIGKKNGSILKPNIASLNAFFWLQHWYGYRPFTTRIIHKRKSIITL